MLISNFRVRSKLTIFGHGSSGEAACCERFSREMILIHKLQRFVEDSFLTSFKYSRSWRNLSANAKNFHFSRFLSRFQDFLNDFKFFVRFLKF